AAPATTTTAAPATTTTAAPATTTTAAPATTTTATTPAATTTATTSTTKGGALGTGDEFDNTSTTTTGEVKPDDLTNTSTSTTQTTTTTTTGTTTTTTLTYPHYYADLTTEVGFYFSHDDGRRENGIVGEGGFSKEQVSISKMYKVDYEGATPQEVTFNPANITFNGATPASVYNKANTTFKYEVPVFYNFGTDGEDDIRPILDADKNQVFITVYIGVKGDVNLDNLADSVDSSQIQLYYAKISAGTVSGEYTSENTKLSLTNPIVDSPTSIYDDFAAFLGDVDVNEWSETNWKVRKGNRLLDAVDATQIRVYYARVSALGEEPYDAWNVASPFRFGGEK
ncbi:MAG: cellulose-binding protein CttA-related protein, partial [Ruminococcus sp.]|nr:cellulose-binding protein CttA-related protein [Ruminococcus sp.]